MPLDIQTTHREYNAHRNQWTQIKTCLEGEKAIKKAGELYLPYPVAGLDRTAAEFTERYDLYRQGAHYVNYTSEAVDDLVASAFRTDPVVEPELPADLDYFQVDEISRDIVQKTTAFGNSFVLVDYPTVEEATAEDDRDNLAFAQVYAPLDVINWTVNKRSGRQLLTRVVLREIDETADIEAYQYRECYLEQGIYKQRVWKEDNDQIVPEEVTIIASGNTLDFIPGQFIGTTSNLPKIDVSPVLGISNSNIKHYQTFAELMWTQTYTGHPQMVLTGLPSGWNKEAEKADVQIKLDASQVLALEGETARAQLLEISASNLMHYQTLAKLEESMNEQGARLKNLTIKAGVESAEALALRHQSDISKLGSIVANVEQAMSNVLYWTGLFMGTDYRPDVSINRKFFAPTADGALLTSLISGESARVLPPGTVVDYLKEAEIINSDIETADLMELAAENDTLLPQVGFENF